MSTLGPSNPEPTQAPADAPPNPLHVVRDAALLIKAQTTKLGLLLITPPFTPSAVTKVLQACEAEALLGMMGAWEILISQKKYWSGTVVEEVRTEVLDVVRAFQDLLEKVENLAEVGGKKEEQQKRKEGILAATGLVWESCDRLVGMAKGGVVSILVKKVEAWRAQLKDAIEELKEWGEEADDDEDDFEDDSAGSGGDSFQDMFSAKKLPKNRTDIRALLEESLKSLRLVSTLYQAVLKRRIKPLPFTPPPFSDSKKGELAEEQGNKVDTTCETLKRLPDKVDDLAGVLYELDKDGAESILRSIQQDAEHVATDMKLSWEAKEDEFTTWVAKWKEAMAPKGAKGTTKPNGEAT
jgi:Grap2 and cyclin-D-interacting